MTATGSSGFLQLDDEAIAKLKLAELKRYERLRLQGTAPEQLRYQEGVRLNRRERRKQKATMRRTK